MPLNAPPSFAQTVHGNYVNFRLNNMNSTEEKIREILSCYKVNALKELCKKLGNTGFYKIRGQKKLIDFVLKHNNQDVLIKELTPGNHKKKRKLKLGWVVTLISVIAGVLTILVNYDYFRVNYFEIPKKDSMSFSADSSSYLNILVIPFNKVCEYNGKSFDVGYVITERLNKIIMEDSLNAKVRYDSDFIANKNFSEEDAKELLKITNSDQVVFGSYTSSDCNIQDEICLNYITSEKFFIPFERSNLKYNEFVPVTLSSLREGFLQEQIDIIIYWLAAVGSFQKKKTRLKTVQYLDILIDEYDFFNSDVLNLRGMTNFLEGNDKEAFVDFSWSLKLGPRYADILYMRGAIYQCH